MPPPTRIVKRCWSSWALPCRNYHPTRRTRPGRHLSSGTQEPWIDTQGEFLACVAAEPVYRLLGKKGLGTTVMPPPDTTLADGELAFRQHTGGHVDLPNWPAFLQWVQRYFGKAAAP